MEEPTVKKTFWERLGRGVAQGWEKARETSSKLGEYAALKLDLKNARDHLEDRYRLLGRIAADRLLDRAEGSVDGQEPGVKAAVEEIKAARSALAAIEKRVEDARSGETGDRR